MTIHARTLPALFAAAVLLCAAGCSTATHTTTTAAGSMPAATAAPAQPGPGWVLSAHALGPLKLYKGAKVSEAKLKALFPGYRVTHEIDQGDSPDFHYFEVRDADGEPLFAIRSYIEGKARTRRMTAAVPIDLVQVYSPKIADAWGLRVGDHVQDIMARRGGHLEFGASHHDVYLGGDMIYYGLITERKTSPAVYRLHEAVQRNLEIRFISWPEAAWE